MSDEVIIGPNPCVDCGGEYGDHADDCSFVKTRHVCGVCNATIWDDKDLCNNVHIGPCHLSCLLLDAMENTKPHKQKEKQP